MNSPLEMNLLYKQNGNVFTTKCIAYELTIKHSVGWGSRICQLHLCRGVRPL